MYIKRRGRYNLLLSMIDLVIMVSVSVLCHFIVYPQTFLRDIYSPTTIFLCGCVIMAGVSLDVYNTFIDRTFEREIISVIKQYLIVAFFYVLYSYLNFSANELKFIALVFFIGAAITFTVRTIMKKVIARYFYKQTRCKNIVVAATMSRIESTIKNFIENEDLDYNVISAIVIDAPDGYVGKVISDVKVAANMTNIKSYLISTPIDDVYVNIGYHNPQMKEIIEYFEQIGATIHIELNCLNFGLPNARIETISGTKVLTVSNNVIPSWKAFVKRLMDIIGGLIGCVVTLLLCIFVVPAIKISDKGPVFFKQVRIGRNGRKFKMYKFRSMYTDAEERKAELIKQKGNEMGNDMMFKMKNDPRIIPGIGNFIRKTSIDEFPQFFNVLKGDMSLVGTRPPTEDEFKKYSLHHKNRLSFKPGITGMWQASGRSSITNFEEVVELDTKYISEWSIGLDVRIILKTIVNVITGKGAE